MSYNASGLTAVAAALPQAVCRPIDGKRTFGWAFENPMSEHPGKAQGGIDYAVEYLAHMIDQGFHVAYAVSLAENGIVYLQVWELPQAQKPWPDDDEIVFASVWYPMRLER